MKVASLEMSAKVELKVATQANDNILYDSSCEAAALLVQRQFRGLQSRKRVWRYVERMKLHGDRWMAARKNALEQSLSRDAAARVGVKAYSRYAIVARVCFLLGIVPSMMWIILPPDGANDTACVSCQVVAKPYAKVSLSISIALVVAGGIASCRMQDPIVHKRLVKATEAFLCLTLIGTLCVAAGLVYKVSTFVPRCSLIVPRQALEYEHEQSHKATVLHERVTSAAHFHQSLAALLDYAYPRLLQYDNQNGLNKTETWEILHNNHKAVYTSLVPMLNASTQQGLRGYFASISSVSNRSQTWGLKVSRLAQTLPQALTLTLTLTLTLMLTLTLTLTLN